MFSRLLQSLIAFLLVGPAFAEPGFNRDILPILSDACFNCHGPDSATREAGLRLDREKDAQAPRKGTPAIVPGDPEARELVRRIPSDDPDEVMPPPDTRRQLRATELNE